MIIQFTGTAIGFNKPGLFRFLFRESVKAQKQLLCKFGSSFLRQKQCLLFDGLRVHVITSFSTVRSDIVTLPRASFHSGFGLGRPPFVHYFGGAGVFPLYKSESKFHRHAYL